ncbi:peptidoglycan-binding protein [Streptomyces sp. G44]|uniref:peptidoglycan-binding domain-containing protein n=1 Tax=Streptomyces sp. G44 TaxID=2807632 RepID=UPI001EF8D8C7|nr:peptidoglycan-binding domain-containing protein [Streptomyces sp. G44]
MTKTMRRLVPAALAGALLLGGAASATAAAGAPAAADSGQSVFAGWQCGYDSGSKYADRGDSGKHVKEIQCLLRDFWGYSIGSSGIDGKFGPSTESAVKKFQRAHGLSADGIVGPNTWKKLRGN